MPEELIIEYILTKTVRKRISHVGIHKKAVEDSFKRLISPSIENEVRNELTELAGEQAIKVFAENLRHLLLQPPVGRVVLGLDPAYRTGCKLAVVDDTGKVLATDVIYPTAAKQGGRG